jgi:purine-binding chemotaxis protein CheW
MSSAPQTERASWADLAAQAARQGEEAAPEELRQLLSFEVAGAPYALPVECVREIVRLRVITPVPRTPADVRGVISLRGEIVQVVDLRRRLGLGETELSRGARIVVVQGDDSGIAGLLVDRVREVLRVAAADMLSQASGEGMVSALVRRAGTFVSLMDLERVLDFHAGN